ncbi:hypothetical protein J4573_44070 [Actinomadura barringtoniae]|uniref:Acyl-CoA dehydrogenase/oxidase C-terminal domain-containing protein n=2 Tax=Actinomadura barringtoniae TaxID=1427535 RepID=A0A939PKR5_9ACTN|nr:hypothetical protein [Actinomadura barringtoniae]
MSGIVSPERAGSSRPPMTLTRSAMLHYLGGGAASGADGALHVAGDPLVGAADVERRLVRAVGGADGHEVAGRPLGDVAARVGVGAPQPQPHAERLERLVAVHAKASMAKLSSSEAAGRVVDRCVQIFGGRGYDRDCPVERLYRELRVDRIWEGTSEIQRLIIAGELRKRGLGFLNLPA